MKKEIENLLQKAEQLFEQEKFNEVIELLNDNVLEEYKDAELYA